MDVSNHQQAEREARLIQANREELVERIARAIREDGTVQPLQGLYLGHLTSLHGPIYGVMKPSVAVIVQGSKEVLLGKSRYRYDSSHYLLATIELPSVRRVLEASKERPYLSIRLELTPAIVSSVLLRANHTLRFSHSEVSDERALSVSLLDENLLDAFVRLVRLLESPGEAQVMLPLITQEIIYRLLIGEQGARLRHLAILGGYTPSIAKAIGQLRQDFDLPLNTEKLAHELNMSVSVFHQHFKAVTAMSPLQFQKQLRLQEARRLMLSEKLDAADAAFRVGYQDASHFNRDYRNFFGAPPIHDVRRIQEEVQGQAF